MNPDPPILTRQPDADRITLVLSGCWNAAQLADRANWQRIQQALTSAPSDASNCTWDLRRVGRLDHTGAQLLWNSWARQWPVQLDCTAHQRTLLERVARLTAPLPTCPQSTIWTRFLRFGHTLWCMREHVSGLTRLLGQLAIDCVALLRAPRRGPWRDVSGHLYHLGATALPVTALVGFMIGIVLAYLMAQQLHQFGADAFIVNILGIALIRELGPMLAAILIAGRSGSAMTAQIGVMRVTEELDAMRVMGIAKGFRLVLPRVLASALGLPLIAVWTTAAALFGGMVAIDVVLGMTPAYFFASLPAAVAIDNLWLGLGKSVVFGILIALIACYQGLRVKPNTESLGQGTTTSVVTSITLVLLVDAAAAVLFKNVGL